jgi:hypothetical protein
MLGVIWFNRCSTLGYAPGLTHKHKAELERPPKDKHSSLLRKFVNCGHKKFYNTATWFSFGVKTKFGISSGAKRKSRYFELKRKFLPQNGSL